MTKDLSLYIILALLPLSALMLVLQVNPYHALIIRGVLGAIAATVEAVLGAADVALTEALVGTMLSVTLSAIAVRSSLVLRLGVLENELLEGEVINNLRSILSKHYLRLELVNYTNTEALYQALCEQEVHGVCVQEEKQPLHLKTRIQRIYNIIQSELSAPGIFLNYENPTQTKEKQYL